MSYTTYLRQETFLGAHRRFGSTLPHNVHTQLENELALIEELQYESYFLTVYDIVQFAHSQGILCQGRGSAANSAVCYCLGITAVDPERSDTLFGRRSEEHTSELQSLMRISYAVFCLKKKNRTKNRHNK